MILLLIILFFLFCIFKNNNIEKFNNNQQKDIDEMKKICKKIKNRKVRRKCNKKKKQFIRLIKTINNLEAEKVKIENNLNLPPISNSLMTEMYPIKEDLSTKDKNILATVRNNNNECKFLFNIVKQNPTNINTYFPLYEINRNNRTYYGTKYGLFKTDLNYNGEKEGKYFYFARSNNDINLSMVEQNYPNIYIVNYYNNKVLKWNGNKTGHDFSFGNVNDSGTLFSIQKGLIREGVCN